MVELQPGGEMPISATGSEEFLASAPSNRPGSPAWLVRRCRAWGPLAWFRLPRLWEKTLKSAP